MAAPPERPPWANNGPGGGGSPQEDGDDAQSPLFQSDDFRLWCMKVIPCTKRFVHDWTICPFAHAGEKAVRRDPRLHNYTGIACPDMKKTGACIRGEKCPYAHNVFEYWLHPTRYRTQLCNDGPTCRRGICFFAHSLEELRVPACKPYVSPEALARASLEAIQQNPHPLGQQLPNPVAAAQQQAALAAMGRPGHDGRFMRGICGGHPGSAPSSLAPSATPFVPHTFQSHGGSYPGPSGGPARYSAPGGGLLSGGGHSGDMGMRGMGGMQGGEYGGSLLGQYAPQQYNQAPQQFGQNGYGPPPQQQQRWSSQNGYGGVPQQRAQFAPMPSCGPRGPRGGPGSGPGDGGMGMGAAGMRQHQGAYPSAPARAASPGGKGFASFAGMQQHPSQAFASYTPMTDGSGVPSARSSGPSDEEEGGGSRAGSAPPVSSGRTSPGAGGSDDLAQSLASLKIALTQQQLAAAAGSNHEVVISTLHQILKDAMAQQGANATPSSSFGGGGPGDAVAAAACAAAVAAQQGGGAYCSSPNGAVGASFGSDPSMPSSLNGSSMQLRSKSPAPLSSSPDGIACYQAAMLAAVGGYTGVLPLSGASLQQVSTPRTSDESQASAGGTPEELAPSEAPAGATP
ncbi:Zn-finger CCCH type [Micractinium conductrix]|uniref:Zn-finger CCCH type n=1 Tax=Micractinium conductrix TaxID=554055 RepID=A0A2P6V766_9CHLO|nr:Zn-finger CCCH type [Micractinium conductrix]|eukprot:PSC69922.1 Zn-finger CCCH type [Micractinium conductrix]